MDRHSLTPEIAPLIVALVRAGASPVAAAEAAGVPRRVFIRWLKRGRDSEEAPYGPFYQQVLQARGQARAAIETEVRQKDPKFWLRYGPGKPLGKGTRKRQADHVIPEWITDLLPQLDPLPEARQVMADQLAKHGSPKRR